MNMNQEEQPKVWRTPSQAIDVRDCAHETAFNLAGQYTQIGHLIEDEVERKEWYAKAVSVVRAYREFDKSDVEALGRQADVWHAEYHRLEPVYVALREAKNNG